MQFISLTSINQRCGSYRVYLLPTKRFINKTYHGFAQDRNHSNDLSSLLTGTLQVCSDKLYTIFVHQGHKLKIDLVLIFQSYITFEIRKILE